MIKDAWVVRQDEYSHGKDDGILIADDEDGGFSPQGSAPSVAGHR